MKQLDFTLSLIDKLTRPLKQAQNSVTGFADKSKEAFKRIGGGALAMWGVAETVKGALSPAIEMYDALNEASARGVDSTALKTVQRDAMRFSMTYGASAVEFVNSTAEISGAIDGLTSTDLPQVALFRRRVAYAFVNARDAGSVEGFINIFDRLGIGYVELQERQPGIDWDVILVRVTDGQIADNTQLMIQIIRQYGRTCRRYQFEVITSESLASYNSLRSFTVNRAPPSLKQIPPASLR